MKALQEENKALRQDNQTLAGEVEQMNRVASYVGSRVAKVLAGARRANNYNAALVGELKRWNRKLEVLLLLPSLMVERLLARVRIAWTSGAFGSLIVEASLCAAIL